MNNRISYIDRDLPRYLPNLNTLILTNNKVAQMGDLEVLGSFRELEYLSLLDNPVATMKYYREFLVYTCKKLRVLDFQRIKEKVFSLFYLIS